VTLIQDRFKQDHQVGIHRFPFTLSAGIGLFLGVWAG